VATGVNLGPKLKLTPYQVAEVIMRRTEGETRHALARSYGVTQTTIRAGAGARRLAPMRWASRA
jgi:hypothetical protein